jgi:hypothetical protein
MYVPYSFWGQNNIIYKATSCTIPTLSVNVQFALGTEFPIGTIFESNAPELYGDCYTITSITSSLQYVSDVIMANTYASCSTCVNILPTNDIKKYQVWRGILCC